VVEPAELLSPGGPGHQLPWIGEHVVRLVGVGHHLGGVTQEEDDDDGGEQGDHGVVSPVTRGAGGGESSVEGSALFKSLVDEEVQYCQDNDWKKAHNYAVE